MFASEFNHTIDDKGRLTLPARFRTELAAGVTVTRGIERCLFIYPKDEWKKLADQLTALSITNKKVRDFRRYLFSGASESEPDKQGRILLPAYLREYANLDGDAIIVGSGAHLEVWNPALWRETLADLVLNAQETAQMLSDQGIL